MQLLMWGLLVCPALAQRRVIGDTSEQRISQQADIDERPERVYRRPPTYLILASRIVRPASIYQIIVSLLREAEPMRVKASLSRDGVEVYGADTELEPEHSRPILLQVPPGYNPGNQYRLRIEGYSRRGGAMIFNNETALEFSQKFLSISISTNKVVFTAIHTMKIRVIMLKTDLLPYDDVADLFILDPDGFIIRKWNSKQLNNGIMTAEFQVPDFPKVGFWTIRVSAQGQIEEKRVKIEKYYVPKFEIFLRMPSFHFDTDSHIEATVENEFTFDKLGYGNVKMRWYAKKVDHTTPLFNDTVQYRAEHAYFSNISNPFRTSLYDTKDGLPVRTLEQESGATKPRYGFLDPYVNITGRPFIPTVNNWTYLNSELRTHTAFTALTDVTRTFYLSMTTIQDMMGTLQGIQVRAEAYVTDFFYNNTQRGWCETRIINNTLDLSFVGRQPLVFKPGMPFETQIAVRYSDQVALDAEKLESSTLEVKILATLRDGGQEELAGIFIPPKVDDEICNSADIDRLKHYGQNYGGGAATETFGEQKINPAFFFNDDTDSNTRLCMDLFAKEMSFKEYRETGVHRIKFDVPKETETLKLVGYYSDTETNQRIITDTTAYAAYAPKDQHIFVHSSTRNVNIGEYVVFHTKSNFPLEYFDWIIVSKNLILNSGRELGSDIFSHTITFSLVVSSEMAPGFHIIVYTKSTDDYLISDAAFYPVNAINRHRIEFALTQLKDHTQQTIEATCRGDPGAAFMVSTPRQFLYGAQGKNLVTKASIMESLYSFEARNSHVHRVFWTDREGEAPDRTAYYPSMDYGVDTNRTFELQDLIIFTDFLEVPQTVLTRQCNQTANQLPCLVKGCYAREELCDGVRDCDDGWDESDCGDPEVVSQELTYKYRMSRFNRYDDFYDNWDGEWGWFDTNIDEDREQFVTIEVPETADDWFFTAFSVSREYGIAVFDELVEYSTIRPLFMYCEAAEIVHRGETVTLKCTIFNWTPNDMEAVVVLEASDDYDFVHVEEFGYVASYNPRRSSGEHHHFMFIRGYPAGSPSGQSSVDVYFPIAPKIQHGTLEATVSIRSQLFYGSQTMEIEVIGEASLVHRHTSVLLDLKTRAFELEFMNIIVDEDPVIPYEVYRRYVSGSPVAKVTVSGDTIGPTFPEDMAVTLETLFPTGHGRHGKGTHYHAFNLAANTWQLHYLRLTNQLTDDNMDMKREVFKKMNEEYTGVMRRFNSRGALSMWDNSEPSVWLTSWVLQIFEDVAFQDWEDFIYIDPNVFGHSTMWLLNYQKADGAFVEVEGHSTTIHKPMAPREGAWHSNMTRDVPLTAHVLLTLIKVAPTLTGRTKKYASTGRHRAMRYLERALARITEPYDLAIAGYALALSRSAEADTAYGRLLQMKRSAGGMVYWSPTPIATNNVRYEFNRPFLEAKDRQINDALAVETTGYALLTLFVVEGGGITVLQDQIVKWLNTMRLGVGGFISTVDTIVALEALVRYSYNNNIKDLTAMKVMVDLPDSNITEYVNIDRNGISQGLEIAVPNVWGTINMEARGRGQALVQLDITYGVDYEHHRDIAPKDCFHLKIKEYYHGRNKSEIVTKSCFRWKCTEEAPVSGMAMLVLDIPSGYIMLQPDANKVVRSGVLPQLKDSDVTKPGKTIWYLDHVPDYNQCFSHKIRRYYPVANLTRTRHAVIIEPLRPERFQIRTFNSTPLYILSVCEVCGSYQCPYCPFYSSSLPLAPLATFICFNLILLILHSTYASIMADFFLIDS